MTFKLLQVIGIASALSLILIVLPITTAVNALPNTAAFLANNTSSPTTIRLWPNEDMRGREVGPHGQQCAEGKTDDILWTLIDGANNTITLWCKRVPVHTQTGDMIPMPGMVTERQFVGFFNHIYIIGFCPFDEGVNDWHWTFGKNNVLTKSEWVSTALNGTSVTFGFSWNTTAAGPAL